MSTKTCSKCGQTKPTSEFHKRTSASDGLRGWCKQCDYECNSANPRRKEINRQHARTEKGKASLERYRRSEKYKESRRAYDRKRKQKPEEKQKHSARERIRYRIKTGKLKPPSELKCIYCSTQADHYHHHKGYDTDDVVPVCAECHRGLHEQFQRID